MPATDLASRFKAVRNASLSICEPLEIEDYQIQPMIDASPPKWHLAHVSWFFETFLLKPHLEGYRPWHESFEYLFNSYYNGVGEQFPRPRRGMLSRPTVREVLDYRAHVDHHMGQLLDDLPSELEFTVTLGLHHEQQHQELMFTDLKYNFGNNPIYPPYRPCASENNPGASGPMKFVGFEGGIREIGRDESAPGFGFDNESPRHEVLLRDFALGDRLVTNGEYLAFIEDKGYQRPELWLSDAWTTINDPVTGFSCPLYWLNRDGEWFEYTLAGLARLDADAPVCHVSAYEADAYARWAGKRLPSEAEWEVAAEQVPTNGNFVEDGRLHPAKVTAGEGARQLYGDVWEWTQSSYAPYPGFAPFSGQLGEYNGKFMANQLVLRGGSCVTPRDHIRPTYRNFFYPGDRWQFSGIRLASDD